MAQMFVIGEDALCCALGTKLVTDVLRWRLAQPAVDTKGVTQLKKNISRYIGLTHLHPVLCVADTDGGCALRLRKEWLPRHAPNTFFLRLAVTESESWLLADAAGFAQFMDIAPNRIPSDPDDLPDPKRTVLTLARRSRRREIRQEIISSRDPSKPGSGYNLHLGNFVANHWRPNVAANASRSLARAIQRLREIEDELPNP